ncbi:MAG: rhomboid family intramembrane serine protease [Nitrospinae bacterium]|nr:rhomboid family intramembrane serine protease [Nitrospinota bacterium]MCH8312776.1 rhomboid family intramembrane serine protease [Nitrospinota bacterium]
MIPLSDDIPTRNFPLITLLAIGANIWIYFEMFFSATVSPELVFNQYGLVPYNLIHSPVTEYPAIYSSMFIHSGFFHLAGNMLYLWIFGNNIEDVLGKFRFILFYLVCGTIAALGHIATNTDSIIPMVGASGAVSGVLGAYLVLFPFARVKTLIFIIIFVTVIRIPALVLLGLWIALQVLNGIAASDGSAGVAWFAHIGGFLAGMILILPFRKMRA